MEMSDVKTILRTAAKEIEDGNELLAEEILDAADEAEGLEKDESEGKKLGNVKKLLRVGAKDIEDKNEALAEKMLDAADEAEDIEKEEKLDDDDVCEKCSGKLDDEGKCEKCADELTEEKLNDPDTMTGIHGPNPTATKKASLINEGDRIICVNPLQGLFKGYIYIAGPEIEPGLRMILEEDGKKVGLFKIERFLPDTNAF